MHRGQAQHVEIRPLGGAQRLTRRVAASRRGILPRGERRALGFAIGQRRLEVVDLVARFERKMADEQLVEDHAERVHVGVHADMPAANLLGGRVRGCEQPQPRARAVLPRLEAIELLGDPEVEQLHDAVVADENVRRLEVAVHDEMPVRVLDCFAHVAKEPDASHDGGRVRAAILGERRALDVLHHEPGRAVGERARVVETRDERMVQLRQRALLAGEPLASRRREPRVAQNLDRRHRAEVLALGEVDDAHPALAEHPRQSIRSEALSRHAVLTGLAEHRISGGRDAAIEQRVSTLILGEQGQGVVDE